MLALDETPCDSKVYAVLGLPLAGLGLPHICDRQTNV
jgi:hypothetical protein